MNKILLILLCTLLLSGCASFYRPIHPEQVSYTKSSIDSDVEFQHKFNVLKTRGNRKYARKARKRNIKIVAVKITNGSEKNIDFSSDVQLYMGEREIYPIDLYQVSSKLKQKIWWYLFYGLISWNPSAASANTSPSGTTTTTGPSIPIGLGIAGGNMLVAFKANKDFESELKKYNLINTVIQPGETKIGIIAFEGISQRDIQIQIKE